MPTPGKEKLIAHIDALVTEGRAVLETRAQVMRKPMPLTVDTEAWARWIGNCRNLMRVLGRQAATWEGVLKSPKASTAYVNLLLGTLLSVRDAVEGDYLVTLRDLVFAEAFADLLEQADHLLGKGFYLAAGVLGRAVLEEHLRKWCQKENCYPTRDKPTLDNFKAELYGKDHLTLAEMKHVESLAAVGNDAAHNKPTLKEPDVERLVREVRYFVVRHPLK